MGDLWRDLTELLRQHPVLWVPVLTAEFLTFWLKAGVNSILRAVLLNRMQFHSALGGSIRGPLSQSAAQSTTTLAILLSWTTNLLGLLLYAGALVATAALVRGYLDRRSPLSAEVWPALRQRAGGIVELALRALTVFVLAALLVGSLARYLGAHGHAKIVQNVWFTASAGLLIMLLLGYLLAGPALRVLTNRQPPAAPKQSAQGLAYILVAVAAVLSLFVGVNSAALMRVPSGARLALGIIGALVTSLPYALLYTGMGVLARRLDQEQPGD